MFGRARAPTILTDVVPQSMCWDTTTNWCMTTSFHILSNSLFTFIQSFSTVWSKLFTTLLNCRYKLPQHFGVKQLEYLPKVCTHVRFLKAFYSSCRQMLLMLIIIQCGHGRSSRKSLSCSGGKSQTLSPSNRHAEIWISNKTINPGVCTY
jgi:hypothetical protein